MFFTMRLPASWFAETSFRSWLFPKAHHEPRNIVDMEHMSDGLKRDLGLWDGRPLRGHAGRAGEATGLPGLERRSF